MKKAVITVPFNEAQKARVIASAKDLELEFMDNSALTEEIVNSSEVLVGMISPKLLHAPERLELLQLASAGADAHVSETVVAPHTVICNSTGAYSQAVAEHAFALTIFLQKKLYLYRDAQAKHSWTDFGMVGSLNGATVLIIGLGDIGASYARMVKSMGAKVIGVRRRPAPLPDYLDELHLQDSVDELLPLADVVISIMPQTKDTIHFFTAERFALMKQSALFINVGRGTAVEMSVLADALTGGQIAAAAVDVLEQEPLSPDSALWDIPNLVITPHIAGFNHHPSIVERICEITCENLRRFSEGRDFINVVDRKTGYKA